jgi:EAL domain-containing protein (putative c-di-GMP-specific phosphodiesterase class I)
MLSPIQFKSGTFALKVMTALAASELPANRLELEIAEAVLIRDDETALDILHQLRAIGVRIALDDFGTGYSSLSYLQRFPFDRIKIDRSFVNDVTDPDGSSSIVRAVVRLAAARNMETTAEGVETEAQRQRLRALGCTEMQAYLFNAQDRLPKSNACSCPLTNERPHIARRLSKSPFRSDGIGTKALIFRLDALSWTASRYPPQIKSGAGFSLENALEFQFGTADGLGDGRTSALTVTPRKRL